jgi:hypothetical protein
MLIRAGDDFLEMIPTYYDPDRERNLYTDFEIRVQSFGFTGQTSATIEVAALISFNEELRKLEDRRQGKAELSSISSREFWLKICSVDGVGHMGLFGRLYRYDFGVNHEHLLDFGFGLDPSVMPSIVKKFEALITESP